MTIGRHQSTVGASQTHLTPKWIIDALGPFDLDPCAAPEPRPWPTAKRHIALPDDGLAAEWHGRVWLNPPFNRYDVGAWIDKLARHGNGMCLLHARTEARWFLPCWEHAACMLFMAKRIKFFRVDGTEQEGNSGAPVVLIAFSEYDGKRLRQSGIRGQIVTAWEAA